MASDPIAVAHARLDWAKKHIDEFEHVVGTFIDEGNIDLVSEEYPQRGEVHIRLHFKRPLPGSLGLIAGDAIYSLRATLDGLFYGLTRKHGIRKDAYFPLRLSPSGFAKSRAEFDSVPDSAWQVIEHFQPYSRGKVLRLIHDLEITNKHRSVLVTASTNREGYFVSTTGAPIWAIACYGPAEPGTIMAKIHFAPAERVPHIKAHASFTVCFNETGECYGQMAWLLLGTAHNLIRSEVIPEFEPLFE